MATVIVTSALSNPKFLIPGVTPTFEPSGTSLDLPAGTYNFQQSSGVIAPFTFSVDASGAVDFDPSLDGFLQGRGTTTLVIKGYPVVIDGTALSHDLLLILGAGIALPRANANALTLVPNPYQFISASGVVSTFTFSLDIAGNLNIDPSFAGFASVDNATRTLTISGCGITFDGTLLTHDLFPELLGFAQGLTRDTTHTLRIIPALDYGMVVASGVDGNFSYSVNADGTVSYPPSCAGFLGGQGSSTLVFYGYPVVIDTSAEAGGASSVLLPVTRRYALLVLVPATWELETSDGRFWVLSLDQFGTVSGDPANPGSYKVGTVPSLGLVG